METKYVKECSKECGMKWTTVPDHSIVTELGTWWTCPNCKSMKLIKAKDIDKVISRSLNKGVGQK